VDYLLVLIYVDPVTGYTAVSTNKKGRLSPWQLRALLVVIPTGFTVWVVSKIVGWGDTISAWVHIFLKGWEAGLSPQELWLVDKTIAVLALLVIYLVLYLLGTLMGIGFLRGIFNFFGSLVRMVPVLGPVYHFAVDNTAQILDAITQDQVGVPCIIYAPAFGGWILSLATRFEIESETGQMFGYVVPPTAPNPLGGYLVGIDAEKIWYTSATVTDVFRFNLSMGALRNPVIDRDIAKAMRNKIPTFADKMNDGSVSYGQV
jgi:uncharacterized membrane protein